MPQMNHWHIYVEEKKKSSISTHIPSHFRASIALLNPIFEFLALKLETPCDKFEFFAQSENFTNNIPSYYSNQFSFTLFIHGIDGNYMALFVFQRYIFSLRLDRHKTERKRRRKS